MSERTPPSLLVHAGARASPAASPTAQRLAGVVTLIAGLAALAIALAVPTLYFVSARTRVAGMLEARAEIFADQVLNATEQNPALYNALLSGTPVDARNLALAAPDKPGDDPRHPPEQRAVLALRGTPIIMVPASARLAWPTLSASAPVSQNGQRLGDVQITRSLAPVVLMELPITLASLVLGHLLVLVLRVLPLRLLRQALERATYLAAHDLLTGLPNRALFADRLEQALATVRREHGQMAVLCLDLDHFKDVNDTLGHAAGDALLCAVATQLRRCLREVDTLARLGGDEFAVIQPDIRQPRDAETLALRLIDVAREPVVLDGQQVFVGMSAGIALGHADSQAAELVKQADFALYQAKAAGRGGFCFFAPEMNARIRQRRAMEADLRAALDRGELGIVYQPQIHLASGAIRGAEALMRWNHPVEGPIPPSVFIPVAEETGLIGPLGAWLLGQACKEATGWPERIGLAVNVSPVQFRLAGFLDTVRGALAASGLDPRRLELEVTEGLMLNDTAETLEILAGLRQLGARLAMDDFGTGYASLGYLRKFRFDKIKIDKSFVRNLGEDPNADAIVRAVVGLSGALGMQTNAEGVENARQAELLRAHGFGEAQGFLYWKPMPAAVLRQVISAETAAPAPPAPPPAAPAPPPARLELARQAAP